MRRLKLLELEGFKSFGGKTSLDFKHPVVAIVGPNGSGKSNVVEAFRFVLGEQSMKSMRGRLGADLIFKGSKSRSVAPKASVRVHLDNKDRIFKLTNDAGELVNLNFDTISIAREVYPDGQNTYFLNGQDVRLKDIVALLSSVSIGASGHHIISQGEADRILSASPKDRREMIEDGLGLKVYQYKIRESERKLERTEENMKEVSMLRRENAPHLKFLAKQMEKFAKAEELRAELKTIYLEYFQNESAYLADQKESLEKDERSIAVELKSVRERISKEHETAGAETRKIAELGVLDEKKALLDRDVSELGRKLGRIEGIIETKADKVKFSDVCPFCGSKILSHTPEQTEKRQKEEEELKKLEDERETIKGELFKKESELGKVKAEIELQKKKINEEVSALRAKEKEKYTLKLREQELSSGEELVRVKEESWRKEKEAYESELKTAEALVGPEVKNFSGEATSDRTIQEETRKKIERIKIRLEEAGEGGGADIRKEYEEMQERDNFLAQEMEDLSKSVESLRNLITELKEKIDTEFKAGVGKINTEFKELFTLMFGGGTASLRVVKPEKRAGAPTLEDEVGAPTPDEDRDVGKESEGVEINVSLPQKKVKELAALSGGERSLVSIALLFAMSQVNPPPFLVLDETDAALDESNSRRFGDMLEKLSARSELVVVTHNRETMTRAGVLYGVTLGADGTSKLLSVKLSEAEAIAE